MLYGYLVELSGFYIFCDLGVDSFFCGIIFHCKGAHLFLGHFGIGDKATSAENNNAPYIRRPFALGEMLSAVDGEADLVALFQRIDLVTRSCAVKINFSVFLIVKIVERDRERVAVIAVHGKNAALFGG